MKTQANNSHKNNPFLLSNQVKAILQSRGFSALFNYQDYKDFKDQCKGAFNKAHALC